MGRKPMGQKKPTSIRFSEEARRLMELMAGKDGLTISGWLEMTVRREARRQQVTLDGTVAQAAANAPAGGDGE